VRRVILEGKAMHKCYVIMPFRKEYDMLYKAIVLAAEDVFGAQSCIRADQEKQVGIITDKVIQGILNADIIIAVIGKGNPNVMYELSIAHSFRKPTIILKEEKAKLPFDISAQEAINYKCSHGEPIETQLDTIRKQTKEYLVQLQNNNYETTNPLTNIFSNHYVFTEDLRDWLLGYIDVYEIEKEVKTVWEITSNLHWLTRDKMYSQLVKDGIIHGSTKRFLIIPKDDAIINEIENFIKEIELDIGPENKNKLPRMFKYVAIERGFFDLMPFTIGLYDPNIPVKSKGIICEPMAPDIGENGYDAMIDRIPEKEWENIPVTDRWKEKTFDIRLSEHKVRSLICAFKQRWNEEIEKTIKETENEEERIFLEENWLI
jgi:hypothetical protein